MLGSIHQRKILIVDDAPEIREMLLETLAMAGYDLVEASNGEDALAVARDQKVDLIILDVNMPGGPSGFEVCRALKSDPATRDAFVLMLTGNVGDDMRKLGVAAGADDFFTKPFSPIQLIHRVDGVLG
jgi:two-component system, OmpR family, phosphate regulon response regulator PhoB